MKKPILFALLAGLALYAQQPSWNVVGVGPLANIPPGCKVDVDIFVCKGTGCGSTGELHQCTGELGNVTWTGSGLHDLTVTGVQPSADASPISFKVRVQKRANTADTFDWSDNGGASWNRLAVTVTGAAQSLSHGISVTFAATTGHTVGDTASFATTPWSVASSGASLAIGSPVSGAFGLPVLTVDQNGDLAQDPSFTYKASFSTPSPPVVTPTCSGTCATAYGYIVMDWLNGLTSVSSAETDASNAVTLDSSHYNVISHTCQVGAVFYTVQRSTGGSTQGQIGGANSGGFGPGSAPISCSGGTLKDDGLNATGEGGSIGYFSLAGAYVTSLVTGSAGDVPGTDVYIGTPDYLMGALGDGEYGYQLGIQYRGTTATRSGALSINFDGTDGATNSDAILLVDSTEAGNPNVMQSIFSAIRNYSAASPVAEGDGFVSTFDQNNGGGYTLTRGHVARIEVPVGEWRGFDAEDPASDGGSAAAVAGFRSEIVPGAGSLAFNDAGGAGIATVGLYYDSSAAPGISGCNTATIDSTSTNTAGIITAQATGSCVIALTFTASYPHGASCFLQNITHPADAFTPSAFSANSITMTGTSSAGDTLRYGCAPGF
jgi:hypothetical protein